MARTRCHIVKLKCIKFAPDPADKNYSSPQTPWLILRGLRLREDREG